MAVEDILWTYQDAVDRLMDTFQTTHTGRQYRLAKEAIFTAYRDIASAHDWKYYQRRHTFNSEASYSKGTIAYDHTGGSSERLVTLTGGTWPANAALGAIFFGDQHWAIESRLTDTTLTLRQDSNPGSDVAALTTYTWYREAYPFRPRWRKMGELVDASQSTGMWPLEYVSPDEHLIRTRAFWGQTTNRPEWFTIRNDDRYYNGLSLILGRPPNAARTYEFVEHVAGRSMVTEFYRTGTVDTTNGSAAVVGTGTAFASVHEGAVIRFSADGSTEPTSPRGNYDGSAWQTNPYKWQRVVSSVTDGTNLTLDAVVDATLSGVKYTISDPVDLSSDSMLTLFWRMCEHEFSVLLQDNPEQIGIRSNRKKKALLNAMDADRRAAEVQSGAQNDDAGFGGLILGTVSGLAGD